MQERLSMRKIKEIARLRFAAGRTHTEIAAAVRVARSTVQTAVSRLVSAGLSWPLEGDEEALEARLYPTKPGSKPLTVSLPDFAAMRGELSRKGITRHQLSRIRQNRP